MKDKSLNWVGGEVGWVVWDWGGGGGVNSCRNSPDECETACLV